MEDTGVIKLYEPSPTPSLNVADVQNMVGRVPLIPFFLAGISTPTIPHMFSKRKDSGFPYGCADAAATDGQLGSNVYEVNLWLWQFGSGTPRLGGLTIEETSERKDTVSNARHKRAADSEQRQYVTARRLQPDSKYTVLYNSMYEYVRVYIGTYEYVRVCTTMYQYNQGLQIIEYSGSAHIFFSLLAPKYNVLCLGDVSVHL